MGIYFKQTLPLTLHTPVLAVVHVVPISHMVAIPSVKSVSGSALSHSLETWGSLSRSDQDEGASEHHLSRFSLQLNPR